MSSSCHIPAPWVLPSALILDASRYRDGIAHPQTSDTHRMRGRVQHSSENPNPTSASIQSPVWSAVSLEFQASSKSRLFSSFAHPKGPNIHLSPLLHPSLILHFTSLFILRYPHLTSNMPISTPQITTHNVSLPRSVKSSIITALESRKSQRNMYQQRR